MSSEREKIEMQMRNMSFEDLQKRHEERNKQKGTPKKSFFETIGSLLFWRFKIFAGILGINEKDITSSSGPAIAPHTQHTHHNSGNGFKEQYHFDPEKWIIKEMQAEAYHDLVDGKGDCDCKHNHSHHEH